MPLDDDGAAAKKESVRGGIRVGVGSRARLGERRKKNSGNNCFVTYIYI